jgi:hypothetical protein
VLKVRPLLDRALFSLLFDSSYQYLIMRDDRLQIPIADDYIVALGRAAYVFATLEWNAVWCCERLKPGFLGRLGKRTAGNIADYLIEQVSQEGNESLKQACVDPANEFKRLVCVRNGLLHGKPGTSSDSVQCLFRNGVAWTVEMIDDAADQFAACSNRLNALLYDALKQT